MARHDFAEGMLKGLYSSGVGNPDKQQADRMGKLAESQAQANLAETQAKGGLQPAPQQQFSGQHPVMQKIFQMMYPGAGQQAGGFQGAPPVDYTPRVKSLYEQANLDYVPLKDASGRELPMGQKEFDTEFSRLMPHIKEAKDPKDSFSAVITPDGKHLVKYNKSTGEHTVEPIGDVSKPVKVDPNKPIEIRAKAAADLARMKPRSMGHRLMTKLPTAIGGGPDTQDVAAQQLQGIATGDQPQPGGMIQIRASDGSMHQLPADKLDLAKQRDPGLQVVQ